MSPLRSIYFLAASPDIKIRRLINYWAITALLYLVCTGMLWVEVAAGAARTDPAVCLCIYAFGGSILFYALIRSSAFLNLTPSQLAFAQGVHAIICITAAYAVIPPIRGAILTLLQVVLVFCAFALESRRSHQISAFAIVLLGATMLYCEHSDPALYPPSVELVHFVLAASMMVAVVFVTSQFNWMRNRLKTQKAELEQQKNHLSEALSQIQHVAMRDDLTGLPNRRHMREVLAEEEKRHRKGSGTLCLALLDIDHFKSTNDTYGHAAGDEILRSFAQQIKDMLRTDDVLARWGGEEFLLALPNTVEEDAVLVLERVKQQLRAIPVEAFGTHLRITFSSGLAVMEANETIVDTIRRADKAMFRAKSLGRNRNCLYDPDMEAGSVAREQMKAELACAIAAGQLVLHYQPQVKADGRVTGAEALVRWRHPEKGLVFPGDFIPLAEESDLIIALGQWVLGAACAQLAAWGRDEATDDLSLSVNVSARQLRHVDFVPHMLALLETSGADPGKLKLELTESVLVEDIDAAIDAMNRLRQVGVRFSLDDFGTGYSSLSYLKQMPLYQIKIDRAFVSDIVAGDKDGIIARAIISLSHSLGCNVLAEGVETALQRDFLARYGCHDFQGYWFGKPVAIEIFEQAFCGAASMA
jgi:diguanylate cyclase (GGDEF)-like protein